MSNKDKYTGGRPEMRIGVPESDTGDSGEESEPTYRHYDNFETDMSLTQDEEDEPLESNRPLVKPVGLLLPIPPAQLPRTVSSDSDSDAFVSRTDPVTDDTTTSTSESEETQIWVPVGNRPSAKTGTISPQLSAVSSSENDGDTNRSTAVLPGIVPGISLLEGVSTGEEEVERHSWATAVSTVQKRGPQSKHPIVGLLRHEGAGTITLDIHNIQDDRADVVRDDRKMSHSEVVCGIADQSAPSIPNQGPATIANVTAPPAANTGFRDNLCLALSGVYMIFVLMAGVIFPVAEIYANPKQSSVFEAFYIYLYVLSISFLLYSYIYLLRAQTVSPSTRDREAIRNGHNRPRQTGTFYLRLGALGFGVGDMIQSGLHSGEVFEMKARTDCSDVLRAIRPLLHLCLTFFQLYFVFFNSKIHIHRYRNLSRFGLVHMIATNFCVLLEALVKEVLRGLHQISNSEPHRNNNTVAQDDLDCEGQTMMGEVVDLCSPYLYPCSIQFSLICAGILFVMWNSLDKALNKLLPRNEDDVENRRMDCSSSGKGLFLGIFTLVGVVIVIISCLILSRNPDLVNASLNLEHLARVSVFVIASIAVILAFRELQGFSGWSPRSTSSLERCLLILSLMGIHLKCTASVLAGSLSESGDEIVIVLSNIFQAVQSTLQCVYLLNAIKRPIGRGPRDQQKPGLDVATFLLVTNVALWGMSVFEGQRPIDNSIQNHFYGKVPWTIVSNVCVPLVIFYRFLSTVCFGNIWKHAWRSTKFNV